MICFPEQSGLFFLCLNSLRKAVGWRTSITPLVLPRKFPVRVLDGYVGDKQRILICCYFFDSFHLEICWVGDE